MSDTESKMTKRTTLLRRLLRLAALASTVGFVLALSGYVLRDRTRWLATLMYLPLPLVAAAAILIQSAAFERRRWMRRTFVIGVALIAGLASIRAMRGDGWRDAPLESLDVIQWNVQWGRDSDGWLATVTKISRAVPDIVVLSEAPSDEKLAALCEHLGEGWTFRVTRNLPGDRYWYAIAVLSPWPSVVETSPQLPNGAAVVVRLTGPDGPLRVLAVDGQSDPTLSRTPMLNAIASYCAAEQARGEPVDLIAGDFNAISRSIGFDALPAQRYQLGSTRMWGWRGTYPASLPLYDIDHIWIGPRYVARSTFLLDSPGTNHRGQLVNVLRRN
jgi:endonuclease/exonuclease/phosphatase family metal-dependent hydrolase